MKRREIKPRARSIFSVDVVNIFIFLATGTLACQCHILSRNIIIWIMERPDLMTLASRLLSVQFNHFSNHDQSSSSYFSSGKATDQASLTFSRILSSMSKVASILFYLRVSLLSLRALTASCNLDTLVSSLDFVSPQGDGLDGVGLPLVASG